MYIASNPYRAQSLYSANTRNILRTLVEIVWVALACLYTFYEYQDYRSTTAAYYGQTFAYIGNFWNCYDCLSQFVTMVSVFVHYFGILPIVEPVYAKGGWPTSVKDGSDGSLATFALQTDMTIMIVSFLMIGGRVFKYTRYHPGTAVYVDTFAQTYKSIADFFFWFFTILFWLTVTFYLLFTLFGTNPNFSTFWDSINVMALLTFGYADYDTIYNDGIGFGIASYYPTLIFWLFVFLMVMFAQNIILAIICSAYDAAQEKNNDKERFIRYCVSRSAFAFLRWMKHPSTKKFGSMKHPDAGDIAEVHRMAELVSRRDDSFKYLPGTVQEVERHMCLGMSYTVLFDDGETETGISPTLLRLEAHSSDGNRPPIKGDRVEVRGSSSSGRPKEYAQQVCMNNPVVDLVHEYFQSSLHISPRLDFWLWDHGTVIKKAEEKVRRTLKAKKGNLFSYHMPDEIFDYEFTYEEFKILLSEVVKCGPLISAIGIAEPSEEVAHEAARNLFVVFSYLVDQLSPATSFTSDNANEQAMVDVINPMRNEHGSPGNGMVEQPSLSTTAAAAFSRARNNATPKKRGYTPGGGAKSQRNTMADMNASIALLEYGQAEMRYEMRAQAEMLRATAAQISTQAEMLRAMAAQISTLVDAGAGKNS